MKKRLNNGTWALLLLSLSIFLVDAAGQDKRPAPASNAIPGNEIRASAAYAELLLKRTEVQAELETLTAEYTDEFPKVVENRLAIELLDKEKARLFAVRPAEAGKLTMALGKLMIRKVELEVELSILRRSLQDEHPNVKRIKRKADIYESAVREILR